MQAGNNSMEPALSPSVFRHLDAAFEIINAFKIKPVLKLYLPKKFITWARTSFSPFPWLYSL